MDATNTCVYNKKVESAIRSLYTYTYDPKTLETIGGKTFEEQIKIYHGANIIGGLHGGGLTNILFMNPGTKLLEVRRENDNLNNCYYTLASELGINYYYVNSKSQGDDLYVSDTIISLIDLENLLIKVTS